MMGPSPLILPLLPSLLAPVQDTPGPHLRIDPLLLGQVVETYDVIASWGRPGWENPVWPGWDASDTPILLYLPGEQDALLNHPRPPAGFHRVTSDRIPSDWTLHLRNDVTLIQLDGQNTSKDVNGVETLVVADPISSLRPSLVQILRGGGTPFEQEEALTADLLSTDPYEQLAFVVHEAFHVHQFRAAPTKAASEAWLLEYPWLDAENLAGFALEGRILRRALDERGESDPYQAALELLAVRLDRRKRLSANAVAYEDGTEFSEGLAKYTEWALSRALEGRTAGEALRWARGFRGFGDLRFWRDRLRDAVRANMEGELAVNGDPYGAGALRFRLYYSGMALAVLLDRLEAEDWHARILAGNATLTSLLHEQLLPSEDELAEVLAVVREEENHARILAAKRTFSAAGFADADARADGIRASEPLFTLDYSQLADANVAWGFTPFGITKLADGRTIYGVVPLSATVGAHTSFEQKAATPALHDPEKRTIQFRLRAPVDASAVVTGRIEAQRVELPGVTIQTSLGELRVVDGNATLTLER